MKISVNNFEQVMLQLEMQFDNDKVAFPARPILAFCKLAEMTGYEGPILPNDHRNQNLKRLCGPYEGLNLFEKADKWYRERLGKKLLIGAPIGEIPVLIKNQVFFVKIPIAFGHPRIDIRHITDEVTPKMWQELSAPEVNLIGDVFAMGCNFYYTLEDEQIISRITEDSFALNLVKRGESDIRTAVARLKIVDDDYQDACQHAQQAVEKYLKLLLHVKKGLSETELASKKYGHKMRKLFDEAAEICAALSFFEKDLANVDYDMSIRYENKYMDMTTVVQAIHSSFFICNCILNFLFDLEGRAKKV